MGNNTGVRTAIIAGAICALLFTAVTGRAERGDFRQEFHQVYPLAANGAVEISNISGDIHIVAWDQPQVKVDAVKSAVSQQRLDEAKIDVNATNDRVVIKTKYPSSDGSMHHSNNHYDHAATVDYTITVPRGARIDEAKLISGNISIENVTGDVSVKSVSGKVTATGLTGNVTLHSVSGPVNATFAQVRGGKISVHAVSGNVTLTLPSDVQAMVEANTVSGNIRNDFNAPVEKRMVGSGMKARLGDGGAKIELHAVSGAIDVRHADDGRPLSSVTSLLPVRHESSI